MEINKDFVKNERMKQNIQGFDMYQGNGYRATREVLSDIEQNILPDTTKESTLNCSFNVLKEKLGDNRNTSLTGSILKRGRNNPVNSLDKENNVYLQSVTTEIKSKDTPSQKRVKILTPLEEIGLSRSRMIVDKSGSDYVVGLTQKNKFSDRLEKETSPQDTQMNKTTKENYDQDEELLMNQANEASLMLKASSHIKMRRRNKKDFEHWLLVRYQPKVLSDAIKGLSPIQKKWVKNTGFASILSFKMNQYPQALCYYLASCFDVSMNALVFGNVTIPLTDEDVNEVLGLPTGGNNVHIIRSSHIEDRWRGQFKDLVKTGWKVTANMVCDAIKNSNHADRLFKLNFLVLLYNVVIEGPTNPYVKQNILGFAGDIDQCHNYNWCNFLINNLRTATSAWNEKPDSKFFTGSLPMLVFLYVDRVIKGKRQVRRKKPTFVGWSDSLILDRQLSELSTSRLSTFFNGRVALPLRCKDSDDESSFEDNTWNMIDPELSEDDEVQGKNVGVNLDIDSIKKGNNHVPETVISATEVNNSGYKTIVNVSHDEVPRYVLKQLEDSISGYESLQGKCIMYLLSSKELFNGSVVVENLQTKFVQLIEKASSFVEKELIKNSSQGFVNSCGFNPQNRSNFQGNVNPSDENLLRTECGSKATEKVIHSSSELFRSMESQSKSLSIHNSGSSNGFKTPGDDRVFKVQLDAEIPSFNFDYEDQGKDQHVGYNNSGRQGISTISFTRPVRDRKIADIHKSPYIERITNINGRVFGKEETDVWEWIHQNEQYPNRTLFKWQNIMCYKADFQSMKEGEMIMTSTMDVWSCYLNSNEDLRSPTSARRLFCYTETTVGTLNGFTDDSIQKKFKTFEENMDHILETYKTRISDYDLVFFPIHHVNHYYVVCYNMKNPAVEILDNRVSDRPIKNLYGNQLNVLQKHFLEYLKLRNHCKAGELSKLVPKRLKMKWQTKDNSIDCGLFAMRHMETYFGGGARSWDAKFAPESYTQNIQIRRLRIIYTYKMLSSPLNCIFGIILDEIKDPTLLPDENIL